MDDGDTVKAPITRLRRKLSSKVEEVISPGNTTPTKKRGGKLAAKPQLDLIDENAAETIPKTPTRKAAAKTVLEFPEEKALTPSRRSARIKSNTSIILDPTTYDSPRAKRATRRTSVAGSDNEAPLTPSRQTRRTRVTSTSSLDKQGSDYEAPSTPLKQIKRTQKRSTSSIDKQVESNITKTPEISEVIIEELEKKDENILETGTTTPKTLNPIENKVNDDKSIINKSDKEISSQSQLISINHNKIPNETTQVIEPTLAKSKSEDTTIGKDKEQAIINTSCDNLLNKINDKPEKFTSNKNKSCSALDLASSFSNKRHRTKSWSTISVECSNKDNFNSDTEIIKKKRKDKSLNNTGSGDSVNSTLTNITNRSVNKESESTLPITKQNSLNDSCKNTDLKNNREKLSLPINVTDMNTTAELFKTNPGINMKFSLLIEDSGDSNAESISKEQQSDGQDQCVPIIVQENADEYSKINSSYEPMDIDETMPQNTSLHFHENNSNELPDSKILKNLSLTSMQENNDQNDVCLSKSKRKSLENLSDSKNLERSNNEIKGTLILSQINDTSTNENNAATKTPSLISQVQLKKSIDVSHTDKNKEVEMQNLSQDYSTSTPLQQKSFKKLAMKLDSPLARPKNLQKETNTKIPSENHKILQSDSKELSKAEKREKSFNKSHKNNIRKSTSEEELSHTGDNMIDNEAEEASDDYESGDSQDDDDRQYELENEIVEKGETLDSEGDFSDDTDYEKDSFVVSSAEEDNELLSGSGDNLSMSDNELTMSKKSKTKFNERKMKERKRVSREMYNARHRLNKSESSDDTPRIRKSKRQRLSSSALKSDDEEVQATEKGIHSDQDNSLTNADLDDVLNRKKKKVKHLSESMYDADVDNEKEITIVNTSKIDKEDPLMVKVKEEILTPYKHLNVSTVHIEDKVEEVDVNENMSMFKPNDESSDPLKDAVANDNEETSSSSGNEIIENYNSILKDLHKNTKKIKCTDLSLNLEKPKKKIKEPIIDKLNLTFIKTKKSEKLTVDNSKVKETELSENVTQTDKCTAKNEDDATSDSIDMRLLFSEDSNESTHRSNKFQRNNNNTESGYIPLKKAKGQINLRASIDKETNENDVFFIDTKGTREENTSVDMSINVSAKKSKSNNTSLNLLNNLDENEETPFEITNSSGKKKKNKSLLQTSNISADITEEVPTINTSVNSSKKSKKSKRDNSVVEENKDDTDLVQESPEIDVIFSEKKKKKSKSSIDMSVDESTNQINLKESEDVSNNTINATLSGKKKKKHSKKSKENDDNAIIDIQEMGTCLEDLNNAPVEIMNAKHGDKKNNFNKSDSVILEEQGTESAVRDKLFEAISSDKKKKKNKRSKHSPPILGKLDAVDSDEAPMEVSYQSNKNDKLSFDDSEFNPSENIPSVKNKNRKKKKKSKKSGNHLDKSATNLAANTDNLETETPKVEASHESHKKKHVKQSVVHNNLETDVNNLGGKTTYDEVNPSTHTQKKRKRKHDVPDPVPFESNPSSIHTNILSHRSEKKKRRLSQNNLDIDNEKELSRELVSAGNHSEGKKTKNKKQVIEDIEVSQGMEKKKNNKRKARDDDDSAKAVKVFKQSFCDKVYVPRLPAHILNQLEDKPSKRITMKKPEVLSTTNFIVQEEKTARSKPSIYLEESIYLNDAPVKKKTKKTIKIPKVLPFLPTVSTSDKGFTTNFRINILPTENQFVAQSTNVPDFKSDCLQKNKIKKFRTFEKYKSQMKYKISKF